MDHLELLQLGGKLSWALFIFAFGACCGSLINVLVYRLPLGLDVVTSPSRCPQCGTRLTWRENIPVFGWLFLRGRCRFCKSAISPEYPMVEAFVGLLFVAVFTLWYLIPPDAVWLGIHWGAARPEWARNDALEFFPRTTWGPLIAVLILLASLTAMTLVDVKTFTIPLQLPWFATVVGILIHTVSAALSGTGLHDHSRLSHWAIPLPGGIAPESAAGWWWIGASFGGMAGLGISLILLHFGLIRRSFADYHEWEDQALAKAATEAPASATPASDDPAAARDLPLNSILPNAASQPAINTAGPVGDQAGAGARVVVRFVLVYLGFIALATLAGWLAVRLGAHSAPWSGLVLGIIAGPLVASVAVRSRFRALSAPSPAPFVGSSGGGETTHPPEPTPANSDSPADLWIQYPHARREMVKEMIFLTPCIALAWLGGTLAAHFGAGSHPFTPPFWLVVLCGTLMGYLIGGAVVWGVRIPASLAFGKEAIGLGDVHLMAAVGACVGWIDAAIAFPLAAAVGLYCTISTRIMTGTIGRALPFGPYLAAATVLVVLGKPLVKLGLNALMGYPPGDSPIDIP